MASTPNQILSEYWGYDTFRPLQEEIIQAALNGQDTLALLPTGGGKSICYQVPALCAEGVCIVVSPLIALMQDQVRQLKARNIAAEAIYSGMSYQDIDRIFDNAVYGDLKLLYLSPERLRTEIAQSRIGQMNVNLLAVDEAHCISQWGYDFRPSYLQIAEIRKLIPDVPVLALTATATPRVAEDIKEKLLFGDSAAHFQKSFKREQLSYVVLKEEGKEEKLFEILSKVPGSSIVYVRNRRRCKEIASWFQSRKISADYYHAGLTAQERTAKQEAWIQNKCRVMVCTNAFGMGIDKPDVRTVFHFDLPDSPEAYFQEAGRAGRDGIRSYAVLLSHVADRDKLEKALADQFPEPEIVKRTYRALGSYFQLATGAGEGTSHDFDLLAFAKTYTLDLGKTHYSLKQLEQNGWITLTESVFIPSSYRVVVDKETLYDYQIKNKEFERILKTLLRINAGAFRHYVPLREKSLAKFLKMEIGQLVRSLEIFDRDGIIKYRPLVDRPQLIFTRERVAADNLILDHNLIRERKAIKEGQVTAILSYVEETDCRQKRLLEYFGEELEAPCGVCDLCLERKQLEKGEGPIRERLEKMLRERPRNERELLAAFSSLNRKTALQILNAWIEEEEVVRTQGKLAWRS